MILEKVYVIAFESTHYAMAAEKTLREKEYDFDTIPTPREISVSCGLSIMFEKPLLKDISRDMIENKIKIEGIYEIRRKDRLKIVKQIQ